VHSIRIAACKLDAYFLIVVGGAKEDKLARLLTRECKMPSHVRAVFVFNRKRGSKAASKPSPESFSREFAAFNAPKQRAAFACASRSVGCQRKMDKDLCIWPVLCDDSENTEKSALDTKPEHIHKNGKAYQQRRSQTSEGS
jgi:hypothetical protein